MPQFALRPGPYVLVFLVMIALQAGVELAMGRPPMCACGRIELWYGDLFGSGLSQHVSDWYSFTHVSHGLLFYAALTALAPRAPLGALFLAATAVEISWEIAENTPWVIDRYRQSALAQGYVGDSVVNSVSDTAFAALGFLLATVLPWRWSVGYLLVSEAALAFLIHDNLTLNVAQLVHPMKALSDWQASGGYVGSLLRPPG